MKNARSLQAALTIWFAAFGSVAFAGEQVLPRPEPPFKGKIGKTYQDSTMDKIPIIKAPPGAPNILYILIDDSSFGAWSHFGGQIPTPRLDGLAAQGLSYTRFHTTALCSPTRAALLTGRNHHSAGTGVITELGTSFPGYTGEIPKSAAMVSEILRQNGYSTAFIGKNHNIPDWETSIAGPFDRWPMLQGFDHFFGFVGGEANQWQPALYIDTLPVEMEVPRGREADYTLNDWLAEKAIGFIKQEKSVAPDRPFFVYFAPGATHAPHHVPRAWLDKFKGQFSQGWDKYREQTYARQAKSGILPPGTALTPRPAEIPAWSSLTADQKRVSERLMEAFAAFTAQTDYEVGRVLDAVAEVGQLDNTLIIWELGDNGASMEGTLNGVFNEMSSLNGVSEDTNYVLQHIDEIGSPKAYNHFNVGWAWAMNTPFKWGKQIASYWGGTRNPLVVVWPKRIKDKGGIRTQFHHVIDIAPTLLEAAGVPQPTSVNGVKQKPIEGVSMVYTFDSPAAAGKHRTQYFEMFGSRAIYRDDWVAATRHGRVPWLAVPSSDFAKDDWELYDLAHDYSEDHDVAAQYPKKLKELQDLFWAEAKKYNVLPLDDRAFERADPKYRPSLVEGMTHFTYFEGARRIPEGSSPNVKNRSHVITVEVDSPAEGAEGVLVAAGGVVGGYTLFCRNGVPYYEYNYFSQNRYRISSSEALPQGKSTVRMEFQYDGGGIGKGGTVTLFINDKAVGRGRVEKTEPLRYSADETFDTAMDTGSPVSVAYQSPAEFNGKVTKVLVDIAPAKLTTLDQQQLDRLNTEAKRAIQ
jgi:arylsulfatase